MRPMLLGIIAFLILQVPALANACHTDTFHSEEIPVNTKSFMESVKGQYKILHVNGEEPKEYSDIADVAAEPEEGVFTMPYCLPSGVCDPGYLFVDYEAAKVTKRELGPGHYLYSLFIPDYGGNMGRYNWEENQCSLVFTNYQYLKPDQTTMILQHVLKKAVRCQ